MHQGGYLLAAGTLAAGVGMEVSMVVVHAVLAA
jgi:hypothetical protein